MNNYLFTTPFSTFEKWYVEYYLNTTRVTSSYRMVKIENLIKPVKRKIKKNNYDGVLPIVSKIIFKSGEIVFRKENKTGMGLLLVNKGDLLISSINFHQGAVALNDKFDFVCSTHYQTFIIDEKQICPEYLLKVMRSNKFIEMVNGIKANGIKNESGHEFIGSFEIPLPSLDDQKKLLQKYHDTLDEAERNRKSGDDYGANLLYDIQAKVSTLKPETKTANTLDTVLQTVPFSSTNRWEVTYNLKEGKLEQIYSSYKYPCLCISQLQKESLFGLSLKASLDKKTGMIPMLRMPNVVDGAIDTTELKYLPYESVTTKTNYKKWLLKKGDFLINRTNSKELVGKAAVFNLDGDYTYASYLVRYRFNTKKVLPEYINIMFMLPIVRKQIDTISRQTAGQCNINSEEIGSIRIPVSTTLKEQQEIVDYYNKTKNGAKSYYEKANVLVEKAKTDFENSIFS